MCDLLLPEMSCLLQGLDDKSVRLTEDCSKMLTERREMWENAAEVRFNEIFLQVFILVKKFFM